VIAVAFDLTMDVFSVSIASGYALRRRKNTALKMAASLGAYQMHIPVLG